MSFSEAPCGAFSVPLYAVTVMTLSKSMFSSLKLFVPTATSPMVISFSVSFTIPVMTYFVMPVTSLGSFQVS